MRRQHVLTMLLLVLFLAFGCASTQVSDRETYSAGKLPRPARIIVYDFVTTPDGVAPSITKNLRYLTATLKVLPF